MIARILARRHCCRTGHRGVMLPAYETGGWRWHCIGCEREWVIV